MIQIRLPCFVVWLVVLLFCLIVSSSDAGSETNAISADGGTTPDSDSTPPSSPPPRENQSIHRGAWLSDPLNADEMYQIYRNIQTNYRNKTLLSQQWKTLQRRCRGGYPRTRRRRNLSIRENESRPAGTCTRLLGLFTRCQLGRYHADHGSLLRRGVFTRQFFAPRSQHPPVPEAYEANLCLWRTRLGLSLRDGKQTPRRWHVGQRHGFRAHPQITSSLRLYAGVSRLWPFTNPLIRITRL